MRRACAALASLAAVACAANSTPADQVVPLHIAPSRTEAPPSGGLRSGNLARAAGFRGLIAATRGKHGTVGEQVGANPDATANALWPWASVTKQVVAILIMQEVAAGRMVLDAPASRYLPALGQGEQPTVRQLLQHRSGLRNPDDGADGSSMPVFYTTGATGLGWCLEGRGAAGGNWRYNNCDYIVLGALLERITRRKLAQLVAERIAKPARLGSLRFADGLRPQDLRWNRNGPDATELAQLARFGGSGGLVGTAVDMLALDRALMDGRLLSPEARATLWSGDPALGYMALGQWSFSAPLRGCPAPVRLVERRGSIGRFQVRNVIAPDLGEAVVIMTAAPDFTFGEVWQRSGFSYDVLSAELCA